MAVQHRGTNWTPEEDRRLLDLIEAGKSWVFISANLKRPVKLFETASRKCGGLGQRRRGNSPSAICLAIAAQQAQPLPQGPSIGGRSWTEKYSTAVAST